MWDPFKRKFLVPITDCFEVVRTAIVNDRHGYAWSKWPHGASRVLTLWEWLEVKHGVKRKWSWRTRTNYLVFDSEQEYLMFLLRL